MRGTPLISALVLAVVLALAGIPVWSLTRRETPPAPTRETPKAREEVVRVMTLTVTSTGDAELELRIGDRAIWQGPVAAGENGAKPIQALGLAPGNDVVAKAKWMNASQPQAIRLKLVQDGETLADATLWGGLEAEDVITLKAP